MSIFFMSLFAILLTVLPLQWQLPFDLLGLTTSESWNGPSIVLHSVSAFFYLVVFIQKKKWLNAIIVRNCFIATALLAAWWFLTGPSAASSIEVARLVDIIWALPLISFVHKRLGTDRLLFLIVAITLIHAQWGAAHFSKQDDLGLYILGETRLDIASPGIAKFSLPAANDTQGEKVLRAYGPYPHPNSLGGVLVVGLMAGLVLLLRQSNLALIVPAGSILVGLLLTFSRSALLAAAIACAIFLYYRRTVGVKPKARWGALVFIMVTAFVFAPLWVGRLTDYQDIAAVERLLGTKAAWALIQGSPWFGVGIGEYTQALVRFFNENNWVYAPWQVVAVHSVPLLIAAQVGLLGSALVLLGLTYWLRRLSWQQAVWFAPLVPLLLFDHYLLTQAAPLVMLLVWLHLLPQLALPFPGRSPAAKQSEHS